MMEALAKSLASLPRVASRSKPSSRPSTCLIHVPVCLSKTYKFVCPSIVQPPHIYSACICLLVNQSIRLSMPPSICLWLCIYPPFSNLCTCLSLNPSVCPLIHPSFFSSFLLYFFLPPFLLFLGSLHLSTSF